MTSDLFRVCFDKPRHQTLRQRFVTPTFFASPGYWKMPSPALRRKTRCVSLLWQTSPYLMSQAAMNFDFSNECKPSLKSFVQKQQKNMTLKIFGVPRGADVDICSLNNPKRLWRYGAILHTFEQGIIAIFHFLHIHSKLLELTRHQFLIMRSRLQTGRPIIHYELCHTHFITFNHSFSAKCRIEYIANSMCVGICFFKSSLHLWSHPKKFIIWKETQSFISVIILPHDFQERSVHPRYWSVIIFEDFEVPIQGRFSVVLILNTKNLTCQ